MRLLLLLAGALITLCFQTQNSFAQCSAGEVSVTIDVRTDGFGYEAYWQLLPGTNNCGSGTIFAGGNNVVGCNGGGAQNQPSGGYGNDMTITEGPFCLVDGNDYKIFHTDDWGDGGTSFDVYVNSYKMNSFTATGAIESWTFKAQEPEDYDGSAIHIHTPTYVVQGQNAVTGEVKNVGKQNWSSIEILYSIDNGTAVSETFTGINIANDESFEFEFTSNWDVSASGNYLLKFWIGDINGNADQNSANDELSKFITVNNPIPNIIDQYFSNNYVFEEIATSTNQVSIPRDLDFHPNYALKQLWIINKGTEASGGSTVIIDNAGETNQFSQYVQDGNAWHFMSLPTAIDFSDNGNFATTPGVQDANHSGGTFTGPSLWPSDLSIYGIVGNPPSASFNGSHLDMLHGSPYSMGIAHEKDNVFWVFDSHNQEIVRYDFKEDHGPGKDYHADAHVRRYSEVVVKRNGTHIPNHMVLDKSSWWLYIVENLNSRVLRLDINSGSKFQDL
ncbi:MAG: hypothetical protein HKN92_12735, partial [Chitinophagales bacterium]|nr:hypothetical protein [Chitinophagales bacterium]